MKTLSSAEHNEWMTCLAQYLNNITFFLILCCLITVSFSFSLETYHPFEAIKELLFHLFVLLIGSFVVVRTLLTSTIPLKKDPLYVLVFLYFCYNAFSFALSPYVDKGYFINLTLLILFFFAVDILSIRKNCFEITSYTRMMGNESLTMKYVGPGRLTITSPVYSRRYRSCRGSVFLKVTTPSFLKDESTSRV